MHLLEGRRAGAKEVVEVTLIDWLLVVLALSRKPTMSGQAVPFRVLVTPVKVTVKTPGAVRVTVNGLPMPATSGKALRPAAMFDASVVRSPT